MRREKAENFDEDELPFEEMVPLYEAADKLKLPHFHVMQMIEFGTLKGARDVFGRWFVDPASLARAVAAREARAKRWLDREPRPFRRGR